MMFLMILSFATFGTCMEYSDHFARNVSLPLSASLYSFDPLKCLQTRLNASAVMKFKARLEGGSCSGLVVTLPNSIALTFKASLHNPFLWESWTGFLFPLNKWRHKGKVSRFLGEAFRKLWLKEGMKKHFRKVMKSHKHSEVWVTGHSLGGGVAALVAYDIIASGLASKDKVTLITLGQPMVGDKDFARAYERKVESSFRVVRVGDMLPLTPFQTRGYSFNGKEVFYNRYGMQSNGTSGFKICNDSEEEGCSGSQTNPVGFDANDVYFRRNVTRYGMKCK